MKRPMRLLAIFAFALGMVMNPLEANAQSGAVDSNSYDCFCLARQEYEATKLTTDAGERDILYAKAIGDISQAVSEDKSNSTYWLLGSQIYRSKGIGGYAKQYFMKAEQILAERLAKEPRSIAGNLDYAIACYAGDVRFWSDYPQYQARAKEAAQRVLMLEIEKKKLSRLDCLYLAMANMVLQDRESCDEWMLAARYGLYAKEADNALADDKAEWVDACCELYDNTVMQGKWLWNVRETAIDKEFLLYCLALESVVIR